MVLFKFLDKYSKESRVQIFKVIKWTYWRFRYEASSKDRTHVHVAFYLSLKTPSGDLVQSPCPGETGHI